MSRTRKRRKTWDDYSMDEDDFSNSKKKDRREEKKRKNASKYKNLEGDNDLESDLEVY